MPDPASRSCLAILLAAGEGTRMRSSLPKPLHPVAGRSMLAHALAALGGAGADEIAGVVGPNGNALAERRAASSPERRSSSRASGAARRTPRSLRVGRSSAATTRSSSPMPTPR